MSRSNFSKLMTKFNGLGLRTSVAKEQPVTAPGEDDFNFDYYSSDEFSDIESDEDAAVSEDSSHYQDVAGVEYHNGDNGAFQRDELYENFDQEAHKTKEMQKTPPHLAKTNEMGKGAPTLPPRKTDGFPQPPARRKKGKKPPLPEKIVSDPDDNQFYEEMDPMPQKSTCPVTPIRNVSSNCQPNRNSRYKEEDDHKSKPTSVPPSRKMPPIPPKNSNDTTTSYKTSMSHCSQPRTELPKAKYSQNPLNAYPWYHGDSERTVVEKKLMQHKKDGMFAVRNSTTKGPSYPYAVTLFQNGKTFNFPIRIRDSDRRFALGTEKRNEPTFSQVDILVDYFKANQIKLQNDQVALLSIPLDRSP